jgi:hypothetical protein
MQQQQMVFARLQRADDDEIGMASEMRRGRREIGERRGERTRPDEARRQPALGDFALQASSHRVGRHQKRPAVTQRRADAPAEQVRLARREIFGVIERKQVVDHKHAGDVGTLAEPFEKSWVLEAVITDVDIDRALRDGAAQAARDRPAP